MLSLASQGPSTARVYTVNAGADAAPDWLAKRGSKKGKSRAKEEDGPKGLRLIQDLDFPEASNRVKASRDGKYLLATGTYKPRIKVFELDELAQKFERTTDAENVDFEILSDDWTKTLHLQADRSIEVHNQASCFYRTRIPKAGRAMAYNYPTCDALVGGLGREVNRLNLERGQFLTPFTLADDEQDDTILGVNAININPAHGLLAFGTETESGRGTVELWDHRAKQKAATLSLPYAKLTASMSSAAQPLLGADNTSKLQPLVSVSVTALASRFDGLNLAVGTSTGHTLLYDLRASRPYMLKDQGYGLPIKTVLWPTSAFSSDSLTVASADSKVIKVWSSSAEESTGNHVAITPPAPINDLLIYPDSGLMVIANEESAMTAYYVPGLGPAPKWCRFLDNMTEEMEDTSVGTVYEDHKFIDKKELAALNLEHLLGTPQLKPYMHGYFVDLRTYTKARAIANPFEFADYRRRLINERLEKERESRIRTKKGTLPSLANGASTASGQKIIVNKNLAARIESGGDKKRKRDNVDDPSILQDSRFDQVFTNPDFNIDEKSREFALINPSAAAMAARRQHTVPDDVVDGEDDASDDGSIPAEEDDDSDSSEDGELQRYVPKQKKARQKDIQPIRNKSKKAEPRMSMESTSARTHSSDRGASLGKLAGRSGRKVPRGSHAASSGNKEFTFTPNTTSNIDHRAQKRAKVQATRAKDAQFGAGLSRQQPNDNSHLSADDRQGRQQRRQVDRSASNGAIRKLSTKRPAMSRQRR